MSLFGYSTGRDLSRFGSFLFMGLVGIILASVVNIFVASSMLHLAISVIGVLVFTGLTAYDTQRIKEIYLSGRRWHRTCEARTDGRADAISRLHQSVRDDPATDGRAA
jgi:FtsH-binding integral membrane protein